MSKTAFDKKDEVQAPAVETAKPVEAPKTPAP